MVEPAAHLQFYRQQDLRPRKRLTNTGTDDRLTGLWSGTTREHQETAEQTDESKIAQSGPSARNSEVSLVL